MERIRRGLPLHPGMIAPGVSMDRPTKPQRRERPLFLDIAIIGLSIAALMYGGLRLLSRTHDAWDARYGDQPRSQMPAPPAAAAAKPPISTWTAADEAELQQLRKEARDRKRAYEAKAMKTRCINGTLFRIEGSSYTNIGRC